MVLERHVPRRALDRKGSLEHVFEAELLSSTGDKGVGAGRCIPGPMQKGVVRSKLDFDEIRDVHKIPDILSHVHSVCFANSC